MRSTPASAAAMSVVSNAIALAVPPAAAIAARVCAMPEALRPLTTTWAPQPASASAIARPRPRDAPVTRATLPSSEKIPVSAGLRSPAAVREASPRRVPHVAVQAPRAALIAPDDQVLDLHRPRGHRE